MSTRREFIQQGLGFVSLGVAMPQGLLHAAPTQKTAKDATGKILVVIEMAGGNDGLNTVIPYADRAYAQARPNIALKSSEVVKISDQLALHPAMKDLGAMYEKGQVAIVNGVGYANPNRSHFHSMDIWQTGDPDLKLRERSGWLARYFDADGHYRANPLSAVALGGRLPVALEAQNSPVSLMSENAPMKNNGYDAKAASAAKYPQSSLAQSLQTIARLIAGDSGTRVYYASIGGFDTHAHQPLLHANLLGTLSEAIAAFYRDLTLQGRDKDVLLMTFSEFGRRVWENNSAGTDHGAASSLFVVGSALRGGVYGEYPSLTDLDDGALKYTTDFRRVYSTVIEKWLGADSSKVLNGHYATLPFV